VYTQEGRLKGLVADLMYFFAKKYYFSNVPRVSAIFFVKKHVQKGKYLRVTPFGMLHDSLPHCARLGRDWWIASSASGGRWRDRCPNLMAWWRRRWKICC